MVKTEMRIFGAIIAVAVICTAIVAVREDTRYTAPETVPLCEIVPDPDAININTAGIDELCMLDGIDPATAATIINFRTGTRKFEDIHDITLVDKVGEKTFERIKTKIRVN